MLWSYDKVHSEFEKCAKEHLNNSDIRQRLYRQGLTFDDFKVQLEDVLYPVYLSAKNCGFRSWEYNHE